MLTIKIERTELRGYNSSFTFSLNDYTDNGIITPKIIDDDLIPLIKLLHAIYVQKEA